MTLQLHSNVEIFFLRLKMSFSKTRAFVWKHVLWRHACVKPAGVHSSNIRGDEHLPGAEWELKNCGNKCIFLHCIQKVGILDV